MRIRSSLLCGILSLAPLLSHAQRASTSSTQKASKAEVELFSELLDYYKKYPQIQIDIGNGSVYKFPDVDRKLLYRLSPEVLNSRIRKFNRDYKDYLEQVKILERQLAVLEKKIESMPISDTQNRTLQEIKAETTRGKMNQARKIIVMLSVQANESFLNAIETLRPEDRVVVEDVERPKMPGVFGGAAFERQKMNEVDKLNLTPVDPEFYETQLGRKLEKDLGGRAQYWSYDYAQDELYVKVNDELGKLRVFKDAGGTRFIRTRAGAEFLDPRGKDEPVDMMNAKGRFLTGSGSEETLFGEFPRKSPSFVDESKVRHNRSGGGDGHGGHNH